MTTMEGEDQRESGGADDFDIKICCMCGDVGFADALRCCPRCKYRLQHSYCSRLYPHGMDMESWGCEWCIHEEQQLQQQQREVEIEKEEKAATTKTVRIGIHVKVKGRNNKAVDRWRKLARAAKTGSGRRYKLLAALCS